MAFKELQSLDADTIISLGGENRKTRKKNPTQVEGYYLGKRMVKSPKSKTGLAAIHFFQTQKGNIGVWGKTDSDRKLSSVEAGTMVRISFVGLKPTPNGDMYSYKVEQDTDNRIEVAGDTLSYGAAEGENEEYNDGNDSDDSTDYINSSTDKDADQEAAATAREKRRQEVEARLSGKTNKN